MAKLEKRIAEWVAHRFITFEQAQKIRDYEDSRNQTSWVLSGLLTLGAIIMCIGVISLIATNWKDIPAWIKLSVDFLTLAGLALWIIRSFDDRKVIQLEVLLVFFLIFVLASIGLISQIYNTGGEFYQALMLWSVITAACAAAARHLLVPFLWTGGFVTALFFTCLNSASLTTIFHQRAQPILMALPFFCAVLTILFRQFSEETASTRAMRVFTIMTGLCALIANEFNIFSLRGDILTSESHFHFIADSFSYGLSILVVLSLWMGTQYKSFQKSVLSLTLIFFLAAMHLPYTDTKSKVFYAIGTILPVTGIAIYLASIGSRRSFQTMLFIVGLRFLILYFQALGGLAMTGLGLVISGAVVIGMTLLWNSYRKRIAEWVEKWAQ